MKTAVILTGCGYLDGAEIRESVFAILALDSIGAQVEFFAPDGDFNVIDHVSGNPTGEVRNILHEAARIVRGKPKPLHELNPKQFDALIMPGGFGAAKYFTNIEQEPKLIQLTKTDPIKTILMSFCEAKKPIGAICIAPLVVALCIDGVTVTLGVHNKWLDDLGVQQKECKTSDQICIDETYKIVSTPAYMNNDSPKIIYTGIDLMVKKVKEWS